ncbi:SDR family oxidoreductase [Desertibaculum subflavum]|uniref:SDR family oxidoreductase n=1 Tax=Desertibaculum subflavum TaxID=2268458 RepID=UPI000E66C8EB
MTGAALVTGAGQRIGRAIALDLAQAGYAVALHCHRSRLAADELAAEIMTSGGNAAVIVADLADTAAVQRIVPQAAQAVGPLDVLVNNAAVFEMDTIETATAQSWDFHLDINLKAPFFLSQAFAAQLPKAAEGNIVNLIDMRVWRLTPYFASYTVSKAGLWTLTQTLAMALAPRIRVNAIGPGPSLPSQRQSEAQFARQVADTPLKRGASPEEIAAAVRFLLDARSMTGQMLALDGGQHLPWRSGPKTEEAE